MAGLNQQEVQLHIEKEMRKFAKEMSDNTHTVARLCERIDNWIEQSKDAAKRIDGVDEKVNILRDRVIKLESTERRISVLENRVSNNESVFSFKTWLPYIIIGAVATGLIALHRLGLF